MELVLLGSNDRIATLTCSGDITCQDFKNPWNPLVLILGEDCLDNTVILDLQKARGIDTKGVHWLAQTHRLFQDAGGKIILHSVPLRIYHMLRFLKLDKVLHLARNLTESLALTRGN